MSARLSDGIQSVRNGLSVGSLFAAVISRARGELDRIGAEARPASSQIAELTPAQDMERFARHYTMQAERDVHESATRGDLTAPSVPARQSAIGLEDGNLGDNVELF